MVICFLLGGSLMSNKQVCFLLQSYAVADDSRDRFMCVCSGIVAKE